MNNKVTVRYAVKIFKHKNSTANRKSRPPTKFGESIADQMQRQQKCQETNLVQNY